VGGIDVVSVTPLHAEIAIEAFRCFGKGRHRAGLNIGDCFSYTLAVALDDELLFKGHDFIYTDVRSALPIVMRAMLPPEGFPPTRSGG
jgi:ribonuclease VapC